MSYNRFESKSTVLNFDQDDDSEKIIRQNLLRESDHISRSEQLLDEQYNIALETRKNLIEQRSAIKSMKSQYDNITSRFGSVQQLIRKIGIRKKRDTIILAVVFCVCLLILLYNIF